MSQALSGTIKTISPRLGARLSTAKACRTGRNNSKTRMISESQRLFSGRTLWGCASAQAEESVGSIIFSFSVRFYDLLCVKQVGMGNGTDGVAEVKPDRG
jgi:hypothetical protein